MQVKQKGFTLVELVVVMAIIAILVALALFAINAARLGARNTERRSNIQAFKVALESYFAAERSYPDCGATALSIYNAVGLVGAVNGCWTGPVTGTSVQGFIAAGFKDPSAHYNRSCYKRGTETADSPTQYVMKMHPETIGGTNPASCTVTGGENFAQG